MFVLPTGLLNLRSVQHNKFSFKHVMERVIRMPRKTSQFFFLKFVTLVKFKKSPVGLSVCPCLPVWLGFSCGIPAARSTLHLKSWSSRPPRPPPRPPRPPPEEEEKALENPLAWWKCLGLTATAPPKWCGGRSEKLLLLVLVLSRRG